MTVAPFNPLEPAGSTGGHQGAQLRSTRHTPSGAYIVVLPGAPPTASGNAWGMLVGMPEGPFYFPYIGTSPVVVDRRLHAHPMAHGPAAAYPPTLALAVPEQIREALAALSLNKSQLADVLDITRPTLYEWLDGQEPSPAKADRLVALMRLLDRQGVRSLSPLNARFVRQPVDATKDTLLSRLCQTPWDEGRIESLIKVARGLDQTAFNKRTGREDRLRKLGYDEVDDAQRRATLGQNVAARDWPT